MRARESEAVVVFGFSRTWAFSEGIKVQEVIEYVVAKIGLPGGEVFVREDGSSGPIVLSREAALLPGRRYRLEKVAHTSARRTFGLGVIVNPSTHYYVPPDVDELVSMLSDGKYCVLCGPRQSGKSTSAMAIRDRISSATVIYLDGLQVEKSWDMSRFWGYLWDFLHVKCPYYFEPRDTDFCTDLNFKMLFLKSKLMDPVTLIIDEADTLLKASADCLDKFFSTLKGVKSEKESYNLHAVLLIGVETVKDLLEGQYSSTPSSYSPFPHSYFASSMRFSLQDVESLLQQAKDDLPGVKVEVAPLAASVMQLTGGHKGLVGTCLDRIVNRKLFSLHEWIQDSESNRLESYVFGRATYSRILGRLKSRVSQAGEELELLLSFLRVTSRRCDDKMLVKLRNLVAEGILLAREAEPDGYDVRISSPLLRTVILRRCIITSQSIDPPPDPHHIDRKWLILEVIKTLDEDFVCRQESLNEYSYQFIFFTRIKAILREAYPTFAAIVLPECKQVIEYGGMQDRLDILVRHGDEFAKFGFELVVNKDVDCHLRRADLYSRQHGAQVFVISFTMQEEAPLFTPSSDSVIFVAVQFNPSGGNKRANVVFVDMDGTRVVVKDLELKKWDSKFSFESL